MVRNFSKYTNNSEFEHGNFSNESLGQDKHFKHVFGVGVGWEFEKTWIKMKNILASDNFTGSYKKRMWPPQLLWTPGELTDKKTWIFCYSDKIHVF